LLAWKIAMIENERVAEIAAQIATANLASVSAAKSEATVDSEGRDALKITIVLMPGSTASIESKADAVLDTLVQIKNRLQEEGEERFPIVEYATQEELDESGDS
jgi:type IV secretory pathway VirJ component